LVISRLLIQAMELSGACATRAVRCAIVACVAALCVAMPVAKAGSSDVYAEQQALFDATQRRPGDHEATTRYVEASMRIGDVEAAIGALERLAFFDPSSPRIKYELGTLYARLGSHATAAAYYRAALASPGLDETIQRRIEAYLPDSVKQTQRGGWSGEFQAGARFQTNASLLPGSETIRAFGFDVAPLARPSGDWNVFGQARIGHDHDFGNQRADRFETRASLYATHQFRLSKYNVALGDVSLGPRLALAPDVLPGATIKPYLVGGTAFLGGRSYLGSLGAGVGLAFPIFGAASFEPGIEWRRVHVRDTVPFPGLGTLGSGDVYSAGAAFTLKITQAVTIETRGTYRRADADLNFQRYGQWRGDALVRFAFDPPFAGVARQWSVSPFAGTSLIRFNDPNPTVDPLVTRKDREFRGGVIFDTPLSASVGVSSVIEYQTNRSNLPNYRMSGWSFTTGPTARF
jgi:hypothetical protein